VGQIIITSIGWHILLILYHYLVNKDVDMSQ